MVCGAPPMYSSLCGPRDDKNLPGALAELPFNAQQLFKPERVASKVVFVLALF